MEYRISKGWRIVAYILSFLFVAGGIAALFSPYLGAAKKDITPFLVTGPMFILFGTIATLDTIRTRVILGEDSIQVRRAFTNRIMQLADIRGYNIGEKNRVFIRSKTPGVKPITLPPYLEHGNSLKSWLIENYPDTDAMQHEEQTENILANESFGVTKDEREFRLRKAKQVSRVANIIGFVALGWAFFYNKPYDEGMFVLLALPLAGIFIIWQYKGLIRFDSTKKSAYPSLNTLFTFTLISLFLRVMLDFDLYDLDRFWTLLIISSILLTLICLFICREILKEVKQKALVSVIVLVAAAAYCYSAIVFTNYYFDRSEAQQFTVAVKNKRISRGKITTYYLRLDPFGKFTKEKEISVPRSVYSDVQAEDSVFLLVYKGKWDVPWFVLIH